MAERPIRAFLATLALTASIPVDAQDLGVLITQPPPGEALFGEVEFAVELLGDPSQAGAGGPRVVFRLDGAGVGERTEPPYRLRVDVGGDNREHLFEVEVYGGADLLAEARLVSPAIDTDLEVDLGLQQLYVTVTEGDARRLDLVESDFAIFDNRTRQGLVTFARGDVRLTAALLIDASFSMAGARLRSALGGATAFVRAMNDADAATLWVFSDRLLHQTPTSNDPQRLTEGLDQVQAAGGTALNDHLYMALKRLEKQQGRRVVVLLSDGIDSHSTLRMTDVAWLARRSRALIYWIRTGSSTRPGSLYSAWKNPEQFVAEVELLEETVEASGGRIVGLERIEDAAGAFGEILSELREQYVLGYYPTIDRDDGTWHRVVVRVRGGYSARTRAGYVDF